MPDHELENTESTQSAGDETVDLSEESAAEAGEEQPIEDPDDEEELEEAGDDGEPSDEDDGEDDEEEEERETDEVDEAADEGKAEDVPEETVAADPSSADGKQASVDEEEAGDEDLEPVEALGRDETKQALHALLFASDRPLNADRLAEALGDIDRDVVTMLLDELADLIEGQDAPYVLRHIAGGYQLTTRPQFGPYIRRLFQIKKKNRLSKSVLETLAIIAYKQPVTRPAVEAIRGVSVSHAFEILQEKRLIKVSGVAELPGRPKLYRTTDEFLAHFGIDSLKGLPTIDEIREMG